MIIQTLELILLDLSLLYNFSLFKIGLLDSLSFENIVSSRIVTHASRFCVILISHLAPNSMILLLKLFDLCVRASRLLVAHAVNTPLLLFLTRIVMNIGIFLLHS